MKKFQLFPAGETISSIIWLLFLLIPVLFLFPYDTMLKQFSVGLLLIFAWFYRNTLFDGEYLLYWLLGQFLIAWFYTLGLGYIYLFMFPAWQLGFSKLRKKTFWQFYGILVGMMALGLVFGPIQHAAFGGDQRIMTLVFALFTAVAPLSGREFYRQQEQRKQLYQANQRLELVIKGEERERIARELHDSLGQSLSVMTIKLDLAQKLLEKRPEKLAAELNEVEQLSRSTLKTVREIVSDMRHRTIAEELIEINQALTAAKIILITEQESLSERLTLEQQSELSYILREAITNIVRHSQASYCTITFSQLKDHFVITVHDNGIGPAKISAGNGLTGMKERIAKLRGTLVIKEQKGTLLRITFPLKEREEA